MKSIGVTLVVLAISFMSHGDIYVSYQSSAGFFQIDGATALLGPVNSGNQTVAQLVFSADQTVDAVGVGGTRSSDTVLDSITLTANSSYASDEFAYFSTQTYQGAFNAGYVYAVIFEDIGIAANDWYQYTDPIALNDLNPAGSPPDSPQLLELNFNPGTTSTINVDPGAGYGVAQVVPEPATALLFGIGGMGAWIIRRRKRLSID